MEIMGHGGQCAYFGTCPLGQNLYHHVDDFFSQIVTNNYPLLRLSSLLHSTVIVSKRLKSIHPKMRSPLFFRRNVYSRTSINACHVEMHYKRNKGSK